MGRSARLGDAEGSKRDPRRAEPGRGRRPTHGACSSRRAARPSPGAHAAATLQPPLQRSARTASAIVAPALRGGAACRWGRARVARSPSSPCRLRSDARGCAHSAPRPRGMRGLRHRLHLRPRRLTAYASRRGPSRSWPWGPRRSPHPAALGLPAEHGVGLGPGRLSDAGVAPPVGSRRRRGSGTSWPDGAPPRAPPGPSNARYAAGRPRLVPRRSRRRAAAGPAATATSALVAAIKVAGRPATPHDAAAATHELPARPPSARSSARRQRESPSLAPAARGHGRVFAQPRAASRCGARGPPTQVRDLLADIRAPCLARPPAAISAVRAMNTAHLTFYTAAAQHGAAISSCDRRRLGEHERRAWAGRRATRRAGRRRSWRRSTTADR